MIDMEINFNDNVAEFELNFNYYDFPSIIEAAKEFTEYCWLSIKGSEDYNSLYIRIEPKDKSQNVKEATYSFLNYILGIMTGKMKNLRDL